VVRLGEVVMILDLHRQGLPVSAIVGPDLLALRAKGFVDGAHSQTPLTDSSPMADPDGFCHHVVDMAFARSNLRDGKNLTVRELALLGQMKEAAVRNSLSKERIAIEKGEVENQAALAWLSDRRDFIPTGTVEGNQASWRAYAVDSLETYLVRGHRPRFAETKDNPGCVGQKS
jgi:hypothetical protein